MDIIFIRELRVDTIIGINDWEREIRQTVILDLELGTDIRPAAASEDIQQTVDYHSIGQRLGEFVSASRFPLVESLAEQIAALLQQEFSIGWLRLRVSKPGALPNAASVGVMIERGRDSEVPH